MPKQNSLPTWAHADLDTGLTILIDAETKAKALSRSRNLPNTERDDMLDLYDDLRLAVRYFRQMREQQEDITDGQATAA